MIILKRKILSLGIISLLLFSTIISIKTIAQQDKYAGAEEFDPLMKSTLLSQPTTELPWTQDQNFIDALEKNNCLNLLAGYKTVLKDPLPGEEENVHLAADYICGTVLAPGEVFSQNKTAGPYTSDRGYKEGPTYYGTKVATTVGGGVCKIASTLYNVAVLSDLAIIERHNHSMPVPYVPYGQDATVFYGAKDFKFKNSSDSPILVWAKGVDNILYIAFYGQNIPPKIEWNHEVVKVLKTETVYIKNDSLPADTENLLHDGMDGATIKSTLTITYPDGTVKTKNMGTSHYNPLPFIVEKGTK